MAPPADVGFTGVGRKPYGHQCPGRRRPSHGAVRKRSQLRTKMMGEEHFTKRDKASGEFVALKKDARKFKGVRKEARL